MNKYWNISPLYVLGSQKVRVRYRSQSGFTLTELMVIIAILGILSAVAWPSFFGAIFRSKLGIALAEIESIYKDCQYHAISEHEPCHMEFSRIRETPVIRVEKGEGEVEEHRMREDFSIFPSDYYGAELTFEPGGQVKDRSTGDFFDEKGDFKPHTLKIADAEGHRTIGCIVTHNTHGHRKRGRALEECPDYPYPMPADELKKPFPK